MAELAQANSDQAQINQNPEHIDGGYSNTIPGLIT
jgi:hypothetical protein